jgi:hypothetical protein
MFSFVVERAAKSFASCSKFFEILEPCPHAVIPGVGCGVKLAVCFGHRVSSVGGKIVPEVFEVDAFPALDQRQGRFSADVFCVRKSFALLFG